jgi:predicted nucleic acid-binding protein
MADKYFVDTNILICVHDRSLLGNRTASAKHERARRRIEGMWANGQGVLSTARFCGNCVSTRGARVVRPLGTNEIRGRIQDNMSWEVVVNIPEAVIQALEIEAQYRTSFWDALILQAAEQAALWWSTPMIWRANSVMERFEW